MGNYMKEKVCRCRKGEGGKWFYEILEGMNYEIKC